jgi:hypothetical protein
MENVTDTVRDLISDMLKMLITYEIELTADSLVLKTAQERVIKAGIPWDMASNIRTMQGNAALQAEAEAEYAPFAALLHKFSPQTLQVALASIRRTIEQHNNREKW